jgi:hypothetical protein
MILRLDQEIRVLLEISIPYQNRDPDENVAWGAK